MNSIDNLREYVLAAPSICSTTRAILVGYIDGIEREIDDMWHALTIDAKPMTDENMAADGWIRLPVDAEGVPIHVGDKLYSQQYEDGECIGIEYMRRLDKTEWSVAVRPFGWDVATWNDPCDYRHHHAPTVEDVLREFGKRWDDPAHYAKGELVETFAEKLRLAGEGE